VDGILAVALKLVDEHGLDSLSMRKLARELGVDPMAIYHHVPNKAAVVSGLVPLVFSRMRVDQDTEADWPEQVRSWVHAYRDLTRQHPNLVLQIVTDPVAVGQASAIIDPPLLAALAQARVPRELIDSCAGMFVDFVNGYTLAQAGMPERSDDMPPKPTGLDIGIDVMILGLKSLAAGSGPAHAS